MVRPVLTAAQLTPPSVLSNTLPPRVPAWRVFGVWGFAKARMSPPHGPMLVQPAWASDAPLTVILCDGHPRVRIRLGAIQAGVDSPLILRSPSLGSGTPSCRAGAFAPCLRTQPDTLSSLVGRHVDRLSVEASSRSWTTCCPRSWSWRSAAGSSWWCWTCWSSSSGESWWWSRRSCWLWWSSARESWWWRRCSKSSWRFWSPSYSLSCWWSWWSREPCSSWMSWCSWW